MTMTAYQREGLHLLGYSRRESEFLFLVATHSNYFTSAQFKWFTKTKSGSVLHSFTRKLLDQKHAGCHGYGSGGRVYSLCARKVYQAIERDDLYTRNRHELETVKTRLVALDFVLAHPQHRYLETEAERVALFEKEWNVRRETLPVKQYRASRSAEFTSHYFVDRFPMFVDPLSSPPVATFTYVDAGAVTLEAFGTHLRAYLGLFHALPKLELIYLAPTARLFQAAEAEFYKVLSGRRSQASSINVMDYFRVRKAWDAKERVASAEVVFLKEAQARYARPEFEELYENWRQGTVTDAEVIRGADHAWPSRKVTFRTMVCGSSLTVFSAARGNGAEDCGENDITGGLPATSGSRALET
jgi:hypothetical protein